MVSMTLATMAMGVWGITVVWMKLDRGSAPSLKGTFLAASLFAGPGFVLALFTLRARLAWLMFAIVPVFANGMLLFLPWIVMRLRQGG
jgi:ABC-type enterochelin transport system permease subunit